ncbi:MULTISPECIES: MarR family winged helix-turn-helix transcriptional regulator [unclassified Sphingopyxis]|nr:MULTISPECIES: MarR family winged helix-turn-helix transcriptional regulator [unclassified Sphingopyxis]
MSERLPAGNYWAFDDSLGYLARLIFRSFSRLREQHTREYDISSGQWTFLRQLWRDDGISQRELSRRLAMRDATTAVTLRALERAGLVRRAVNRRDRREILVHLTPHARRLEKLLMPRTAKIQALATQNLSDAEVETLRRLLLHVIDNLASADPELQDSRRIIPHPKQIDRGQSRSAHEVTTSREALPS